MLFLGKNRLVVKAPAPIGRELVVLRSQTGEVEYLHARSRAYVKQQ